MIGFNQFVETQWSLDYTASFINQSSKSILALEWPSDHI